MVDKRFMGDIARPPMVFSGARAVSPPQPPRGKRPPTREGENGQNTTLFGVNISCLAPVIHGQNTTRFRCAKRGLTPFGASV